MPRRPSNQQLPHVDPERYRKATELSRLAPERASFENVLCGTAGWTDPTLVKSGSFYPKKSMPARERLEHYARNFSFVEVNATYYGLLPPQTARNWLSFTPADFVFDVKAHPILTAHPIDVARLPPDLKKACEALGHSGRVYAERLPQQISLELERQFRLFLDPFLEERRLGAVLLQFPPWFVPNRQNVQHLEKLAERFGGVPLAVEFRNGLWLDERGRQRTFDLLGRNHLSYVCVDEPDLKNSVPPLTMITNPELSIVRFHGHNVQGWTKPGASVQERFDYLYTPEELERWVLPVKQLATEANRVHATFNNCVRDYAVVNAKGLSALLARPTGELPERR